MLTVMMVLVVLLACLRGFAELTRDKETDAPVNLKKEPWRK